MASEPPERPECRTCPYWDEHNRDPNRGNCLRFPATPVFVPANDTWNLPGGVFDHTPTPFAEDVCGEHPDFPAYIQARKTT